MTIIKHFISGAETAGSGTGTKPVYNLPHEGEHSLGSLSTPPRFPPGCAPDEQIVVA